MSLPSWLDPIDRRVAEWMGRHGIEYTRIALGVVFLWFGAIKFIPGWSPAADDLVFISAALVVGATVRGANLAQRSGD